jgi:ABC-type multidrug transport system permease subunit
MSPALAIAGKDLRLLIRDKGALFWACVFPLAFALLFGAIYPHGGSTMVTIAAVDESKSEASAGVLAGLSNGMHVAEVSRAEAESRVQRGDAVAAVRIPAGFPTAPVEFAVDPSRGAESAYVEAALTRGLSAGCMTPIARSTLAGSAPRSGFELAFPAAVLWGLIGCAGAFAAASMAERRSGTHLRLRAAPIRFHSMLLGKLLACTVACTADATLLVLVARVAFGVRIERFAALPLAIASCAICFGGITVLLGVMGRTEQAVGGASWATLLLFAMLGGAMVPLSVMPEWMRALSDASPVKWGIVALEGATFRGLSVRELLPACGALLLFGGASLVSGAALARRAT